MKIIVTGSLGNISKPLALELIYQGHEVTIISSKENRREEILKIGGIPAIGRIENLDFLIKTFEGKDAVYCMLPPFDYFGDKNLDYKKEALTIANNYVRAIEQTGIKKVVHLSSVGAEKSEGTGLLVFHHIAETVLKKLPLDIALTHIRPVSFDYNLYAFTDMVKGKGFLEGFIGKMFYLRHYGIKGLLKGYSGIILSNYGSNDVLPTVSPLDIAAAIAEELNTENPGRKVSYVASDELTCQEIAYIVGNEIDKPYLKWVLISDMQMTNAMKQFGASENIAKEFTEMNKTMHDGSLFQDYYNNRPTKMGAVKIKDFAKDFAKKYAE